jgi:Tfp pilus assembly protein PilF
MLFQSGLVKLHSRQFASARRDLEEAIHLAPDDMQILDALANSLGMDNQPQAAIERIQRHAAEHNTAPVHHLLGMWLEKAGNPREARSAYAAAMAADASFAPPLVASARLDLLEHRWDSARQLLARVPDSKPSNVDAMLLRAMLDEETGDIDAAIREYRRILQIAPNHVPAMNNLAVRLGEDSATTNQALTLAQRVKELAPEDPSVDDTIGWIYFKQGIYRTAITYLARAGKSTKSAQVQYHLAMAYFKAGDRESGRKALDSGLKLDPTIPEAKMAQQLATLSP